MTLEQQRIAIAEACGWKPGGSGKTWGDGQTFGIPPNGEDWHWQEMPDYFNDLNAMHEAEKVLTAAQLVVYRNTLAIMNGGTFMEDGGSFVNLGFAVSASAAQRAEAVLRTLNLYTPTP